MTASTAPSGEEGLREEIAEIIRSKVFLTAQYATSIYGIEDAAEAIALRFEALSAEKAILRQIIGEAKAEVSFMEADEADGIATDTTRRVRRQDIVMTLNGVGSIERREALRPDPHEVSHE